MISEIDRYKSARSLMEAILVSFGLVREPAKIMGIRKALRKRTEGNEQFIYDLVCSLG